MPDRLDEFILAWEWSLPAAERELAADIPWEEKRKMAAEAMAEVILRLGGVEDGNEKFG